jgi:hypothetical protein
MLRVKSREATPMINTSDLGSAQTSRSPTKSARSPKKKKEKKKTLRQNDDGYEVEELQDDKYDYDEKGNRVRYFKVLWVGDWPPSQNPTWEPEENISEVLVNAYLKKKDGMKDGFLTYPTSQKTNMAWMPKKRYTNVAEAFEGGVDDIPTPGSHQDDTEEDDRLVVTGDHEQLSNQPRPVFFV